MIKVHINFISACSVKAKGQNLFSHQTSQTEEDKSWHQLNVNVLLFCHDLISSHPSPVVIPGSPRRATTARRDNSRGYGLTGGFTLYRGCEGTTYVLGARLQRCFDARAEDESFPVSRVQTGSCQDQGAVKWKACHSLFRLMPSDCERLCHVPWLLTQWLGTPRQKPEPVQALCVLTERCVFHLSSHWPEDSAGLTCPHPQSLTSWTQK